MFKAHFDYERTKKQKWLWFGHVVMLVMPWVSYMDPSQEIYDTLPIWITLSNLKHAYQNEETISRIASPLGTPLNGHFSYGNSSSVDAHVAVVVDAQFHFLKAINILIEGEEEESFNVITITYSSIPPICHKCVGFGYHTSKCVTILRFDQMGASYKILTIANQPTTTSDYNRNSSSKFKLCPHACLQEH